MTTFPEGRERTRALALYSAVASGGGSIGLVLGGMLTELGLVALGPVHQRPDRHRADPARRPATCPRPRAHSGRFDLVGALTSTLGMTALVYGFVRAATDGWGDTGTIASFAAGAVLLAAFVLDRAPRRASRSRRCGCSRAASAPAPTSPACCSSAAMFGMFFFVTQFLQGVLRLQRARRPASRSCR